MPSSVLECSTSATTQRCLWNFVKALLVVLRTFIVRFHLQMLLLLALVFGMFQFCYHCVHVDLAIVLTKDKQDAIGASRPQGSLLVRANIRSTDTSALLQGRSHEYTYYTLWSKDNTFFETCRNHYIGNYTWGKPLTKFVDKANVKTLVEAMGIKGLKIPKTLALYNKNNISDFAVEQMKHFPQPYIIKNTHSSGGVSRVKNDTYTCVKKCIKNTIEGPIGEETLKIIQKQNLKDLGKDLSSKNHEMQYRDIPHQIIVEEDIQVGNMKKDVSFWYTSNGRPLFASIQCSPTEEGELGTTKARAFVNMNFQRLNLRLSRLPCPPDGLVKPSNWEKQVAVASALAQGVPGILRIDLYASDGGDIFFSEFTFTTSSCASKVGFKPRVADGLLHAVQYGAIEPSRATPMLVESLIHDTSWVFILLNDRKVDPISSRAFPSPVDLCEYVNCHIKYESAEWQSDKKVKYCIAAAKQVADSELRCVVGSDNHSRLKVFSDERMPTLLAVMAHIDWGRAIALFVVVAATTLLNIGTTRRKNQYVNNVLYLVMMLIIMRLTSRTAKMTFSANSILETAKQSFEAFAYVHPMESTHIALSHFATYWVLIASWRSKSLRNLLFWQLLYESVTASLNEYCHLIEDQDVIHCTRVAFKESMKLCAFDNLIRVYILPPFFVYGYLLPKFLMLWAKLVAIWVGIILLALVGFYMLKQRRCLSGRCLLLGGGCRGPAT